MPKNKKNSTPRTKGGTKPANSDAAVNFLLTKASKLIFDGTGINLVCFNGLPSSVPDNTKFGSAGYVPPVTGSKELDSTVDEDLRLTLRKLSKKDVVTKRKAISEFIDLVERKPLDALQGALPFWPALLSRLSLDDDWRIREATHRVSGALGVRLGRQLLPYLKQIMPWWLAGQCDTYDPVVCAAEAAYTSTFNSEERQTQACKLAIVEIVEVASRLIMTAVPVKAAGEETAARHAHLASVGLQMLSRIVGMPQVSEMETLRHLLVQKSLWKLNATPTIQPQLARSLYGLAEALCKVSSDLLTSCNRFVCRCILTSLDGGVNLHPEADSLVVAMLLPSIWSAALALQSVIEPVDAWGLIGGFAHNGRASLRRLFQGAGFGAARTIYPCLLPFLSRLPLDIHNTSGSEEMLDLLDALFFPLHTVDSVCLLSPESGIAVARASMEFSRYLLATHAFHDTVECASFCHKVLVERIVPLIWKAMRFVAYKHVRVVVIEHWFGLWCFLVKRQNVQHDLLTKLLAIVEASWGILLNDVAEDTSYGYIAASYMKLLELVSSKRRQHLAASKKVSFAFDSTNMKKLDNSMSVDCDVEHLQHEQLFDEAICRLKFLTLKSAAALVMIEVPRSWLVVLTLLQDMPTCASSQTSRVTLRMLEDHGVNLLCENDDSCGDVLDAAAAGVALLMARAEDKPEESLACLMSHLLNLSSDRLQIVAARLLPCLIRNAIEHGSVTFQLSLKALLEPFTVRNVDAAIQAVLNDAYQVEIFVTLLKLFFISLTKKSYHHGGDVDEDAYSLFTSPVHHIIFEKIVELVTRIESFFSKSSTSSLLNDDAAATNALFLISHFVDFMRRHGIENENPRTCELEVHLVHQHVALLLHLSARNVELDEFVLTFMSKTVFDVLGRSISSSQEMARLFLVQRCVSDILSAVRCARCSFTPMLQSFFDRLLHLVLEIVEEDASASLFQHDFASKMLLEPVEEILCDLVQSRYQLGCVELDPLSISTRLLMCDSARQLACLASEILRILSPVFCAVSSQLHDMRVMEQRLLRIVLVATTFLRKFFTSSDELNWLDGILSSATNEQLWCAVSLSVDDKLIVFLLEALGSLPTISDVIREKIAFLSDQCLSNFMLINCDVTLNGLLISCEAVFEQLRVCLPTLLRLQPHEWSARLCTFLKNRTQALSDMNLKILQRFFILSTILLEHGHAHCKENNEEGFLDIVRLVVTLRDQEGIVDFLLDSADLLNDEDLLICNAVLARFLMVCVDKAFLELDHNFWDFVLCNCVAWISALFDDSVRSHETYERIIEHVSLSQFAVQILFLIQSVGLVVEVKVIDITSEPPMMVTDDHESSVTLPSMSAEDWKNLTEEWNNVFIDNIFEPILCCFEVVRNLKDNEAAETKAKVSFNLESLCRGVAAALSVCPSKKLLTHPTPLDLVADDILSFPGSKRHQNLLSILRRFLRPLHLNKGALLVGVFEAWRALCGEMAETMEVASSDLEQVPLTQSLLSTLNCGVESKLFANLMSSSCEVDEFLLGQEYNSDRHLLAAYLFAWHVVLQMFGLAAAELRAKVAAWLESTGMFFVLLSALVRLVPPAARAEAWSESAIKSWRPDARMDIFTAKTIRQCACALIYRVFRAFPALSRVWWLSLDDKRLRSRVDHLVERCLSPLLCAEECQRAALGKLTGLSIRSRVAVREVAAVYQVTDEHSAELVIRLAPNHPLGAIQVEATRHVGVPQNQWRAWQMQLTVFLQNQNGSILDGLAIWRRNMEKKFEGVEDCTICYSILHGSTYQLPRMQCRTCRKRFHAACMLRWFQSSGNPSCPLCRNLFDVSVAGERF